ncbi:MAG TPA: hypothetical protein VLE94_02110 [Burkholderiaceae bacterium]|nr:hypothetical protein [Burkholderiaceae bacterium]
MNDHDTSTPSLRLTAARACAWGLLVAGWVGVGSFALVLAPGVASGFALVALWLLALGATASVATGGRLPAWARTLALAASAAVTAAALWAAPRGDGVVALLVALLGWAVLTALASGVVRSLRLKQRTRPSPPVAAAAIGALAAALVLGDVGDVGALAWRLGSFVIAVALLLIGLQHTAQLRPRAPGCRAGLFDCSLPAWPVGAWREAAQWPTLLAGLAMLPMMAALPWMAAWCRAQAVPSQTMVLLHLAAMFGPVLLLRRTISSWSLRRLSAACAALLALGAAIVTWAATPYDLLGLALTHGAAWGIAWGGQLWAPARRGQQGTSPLRAAAGYAVLTLAFGVVVERFGAHGVAAVHAALGMFAAAAWLFSSAARAAAPDAAARTPATPAARPDHRAGGR